MNMFPVPLKFLAAGFLSAMVVLVGIVNLRDRAAWIDPTDGVFWEETGPGLEAAEVDAEGPGSRAGIRPGDRLISIDGESISDLRRYSDRIYASDPGVILHYVLTDGSGTRGAAVRLGAKSLLTARDRLRSLLAFLHLGIGVFVLIRARRLPRAFHFYLLCLTAFVLYLYSYTPALRATDWWVYALSVLSLLLLPALFVHFCVRFPLDVPLERGRIQLLYAPAVVLGVAHLLWIAGRLAPLGLPRDARSSGMIDRVHLAYFAAGLLIGGVLLLKHRVAVQDPVARQQMKWVGYGALAGILPFGAAYVVPVLFGARAGFWMEASMLFLGLLPLSFGTAVIRYRLMDVEAIARRSAAYFAASSLLLALYLLFVLALGRVFRWIAPQADFLAICIGAVGIALLFAPLRNAIQEWLDRRFYRDQFQNRSTLRDFAQSLSSEITLAPIAHGILERISKAFRIDRAAIFLSDPAREGHFRLVHSLVGETLLASSVFRADELIGGPDSGVSFDLRSGNRRLHPAGAALANAGLHSVQELNLRGRCVGMIALGRLPEGRHFSTEDLDLLAVLAGYAAMALENAKLYDSVETKALELERLKAYTENIIESINVSVLALDGNGRITSCNRAFEALYETTRRRIVGVPVERLLPPDVVAAVHRAAGREDWEPVASPVSIFKLSLESRPGRRLIVNLSLIPLQSDSAGMTGSLIVMDDITEKVRLEDQLLQTEKLSSIGLLAAGIAHEVNTPIAGISSYTQMLLKDTPETDRRKPILEKIEKQTFRAAEIVSGLLNFSRLGSSEFKDVDINRLIDDSLALLNHLLESSRIRIQSRYDFSLPPVYGNTGKLQQVFVNLFLNARDAMPSGGELAVRTGMTESMVVVDISDTGTGIAEENIRRIFDPFFTTKSVGRGTGLGLAVTYGIIQEHGGGIFVDSSSGKGTRFTVKLPTRLH